MRERVLTVAQEKKKYVLFHMRKGVYAVVVQSDHAQCVLFFVRKLHFELL